MTEKKTVTVVCKGCGFSWEMPNIGVVPSMDSCPKCPPPDPVTLLRAGKPVGEQRKYQDRFEQDIHCMLADKTVTIVVSRRGLTVCRAWKKCEHHGKRYKVDRGETACPETQYRDELAKQKGWKRY